ncbi:MAG: ABC transporter permease [Chitinispirillales bacterium]|jgi:phospholipid/cholesterol/gamma-HCH transport system permease protein|nr:ABC transporter permease [Chitinispirillales bacterium]
MVNIYKKGISGLKSSLTKLQEFYLTSFQSMIGMVSRPFYGRDLLEYMDYCGTGTLGIIVLVMVFIGMALSLQISAAFASLGLQMYTGKVVSVSVVTEIGPVACALVFAGRAGSGMASEIGSMVLRHQVDTLRVFGIDPIRKLMTPRVLGSVLMLPALTMLGNCAAILGGYYISTLGNNQSGAVYWESIAAVFYPQYIFTGFLKPLFFGFVIACLSCYMGLSTKGGSLGLRSATTAAFVLSTIFIIVCDFLITKIILLLF